MILLNNFANGKLPPEVNTSYTITDKEGNIGCSIFTGNFVNAITVSGTDVLKINTKWGICLLAYLKGICILIFLNIILWLL